MSTISISNWTFTRTSLSLSEISLIEAALVSALSSVPVSEIEIIKSLAVGSVLTFQYQVFFLFFLEFNMV